jgi:hypothetical protein
MLIGGFLGIILHVFHTVDVISKRLYPVNQKIKFNLVLKEFWATEWFSLLRSFVCFGVLLFVSSEFVNLKKITVPDNSINLEERLLHFNIANFIKATSILAGYFSDSIIYGFFGKTEQSLKDKFNVSNNNNSNQK